VIGAFIAATVVALVRYVRSREPRLLPLAALLALQAFALTREAGDTWRTMALGGVCLAGLALAFVLPTRRPPPPKG
jgi:hypothetical protein